MLHKEVLGLYRLIDCSSHSNSNCDNFYLLHVIRKGHHSLIQQRRRQEQKEKKVTTEIYRNQAPLSCQQNSDLLNHKLWCLEPSQQLGLLFVFCRSFSLGGSAGATECVAPQHKRWTSSGFNNFNP